MSMMSKPTRILFLLSAFFVLTSRACPSLCKCNSEARHVHCDGQGQTSFPDNIPLNTTVLSLSNYSINSLNLQNFENLVNLTELRLVKNDIAEIADNTFLENANLLILSLENNKLKSITERTFNGTSQLKALHLNNNPDLIAEQGTFQQLERLNRLYVSDTSIPGSYNFTNMENLVELEMINCGITSLSLEYFIGLNGLTSLKLGNNQLSDVSFLSTLPMLEIVNIDSNNITEIPLGTFNSTQQLQEINMESNDIETLQRGLFSGLKDLSAVSFNHNRIQRFSPDIFDVDTNLTSTKFHFSVHWNPINCDCKMKWLASTVIEGQCYKPDFVEDHDFNSMGQTDYQCAPESIKDEEWFTVFEGESATVRCPLYIDPPESAFWETPVGNISESALPQSDKSGDIYMLGTGNLKVQNAKKQYEGVYRCRFENQMGSLSAGPLVLDVEEQPFEGGSTILALSISLTVITILFLFLLFLLLKKRCRGSGSSRYRFLLENAGEGARAEI